MKNFHRARWFLFGLFLAVFVLGSVRGLLAQSVADLPRPNDYVSDFANVLSPQAIARLDHICSELDHSKADAQLAIVTVHTLNGEDPADYANELEDKWKMGKKGSDRGALVLLAVDDRKYRIDVGYGLEGILNDAKIGDIGRAMVPYLRNRDYDSALLLAVGRMAQVIAADANVTLDDNAAIATQHHQSQGSGLVKLIPFLILFLMFGGFGLLRLLFGIGLLNTALGGRRYYGGPYIGGGWGGGGFGGGGGGGGGGFGGFGGGSFGGGGAGGDW